MHLLSLLLTVSTLLSAAAFMSPPTFTSIRSTSPSTSPSTSLYSDKKNPFNEIMDTIQGSVGIPPEVTSALSDFRTGVAAPWLDVYTSPAARNLVLADAAGLLGFTIIGRLTHGGNVLNPFADLWVAMPFLLGFFAAAQPLGAYDDNAVGEDYGKMINNLVPAWAAGTAGGIFLRSLTKFALPPLSFSIVTLLFTGLFLAAPRAYLVYQKTGVMPDFDEITASIKVPSVVTETIDKVKKMVN